MKNNSKLNFIAIVSAVLFFSLTSCSDEFHLNREESSDGKTYISINASMSSARTINAPVSDAEIGKLTDFILSGKYDTSSEYEELAEAGSFSELAAMKIPVTDGRWTFRLTAEYGESEFSAECQTSIEFEKINPVSFELSPSYKYGGLKLNFSFTGTADKAELLLLDDKQEMQIESKNIESFTASEGMNHFTYTRDIQDDFERLSPGTYYIIVKFYADGVYDALNVYEDYIRIASDRVTSADIALDLNDVYTIQYELNGGESSGTFINKVSRKSGAVTVPSVTKEGFIFDGWYSDSEYTAKVSSINVSTLKNNLTLYAHFVEPVLYVSSTGIDSDSAGWKADSPLATLNAAVANISSMSAADYVWTIFIDGSVSGNQIIPDSMTASNAKALVLAGQHGLDDDGIPLDALDANQSGTTLTVNTAVPVTVTNLKITGGKFSGDEEDKGGGITISSVSTVLLADGALVTGNSSYNGGGINSSGSLYIYGSAVVGTKDASSVASASSYGNKAEAYGGGIYAEYKANGGIFLGYKLDETGTRVEAELTGGIYQNYNSGSDAYAYSGGGVYSNATLMMASGTVAYNAGPKGGGMTLGKSSTLIGGTIRDNSVSEQTYFSGALRLENWVTVSIGGSISIPSGSDGNHCVYISSTNSNFKIISELEEDTVARIRPPYWDTENRVILTSDDEDLLKTQYTRFSIVSQTYEENGETVTVNWYIGEDGILTNVAP
ncbi:putative repeat protein (TIGR02543 family) [Treponema rectale]|uniref:Putative repeat protein (TIGR02543 family) n=1 Tax=Treponema rectale TaxID=744512 RepID=A0A840SGW0_9SPIR|nr:InlB B-repeat-containing protein [Treponema rectale]MBB5218642.1 putative repeat protein (TIGR02543 family) [Treponema rectale]